MNLAMTGRTGFSLIETVIYMALVALVIGALLVSTYSMVDGSVRLQNKAVVSQEGLFLVRKLDWALSGATAVSVPNPITLRVTRADLPAGESPLEFTLTDTTLTLARGTGAPEALQSASVAVEDLTFTYAPELKTVRAVFMTAYADEEQSFDATRYIRP